MSLEARSSQESAVSAIPAKPLTPAPETPQEAAPLKVSLADENIALKQRIALLESENERLRKRVTTAEELTITAKFETDAAIARAQKRYTKMLHANNEIRHLRLALAKEKKQRADYLIGSKSVFQSLQDEISRLKAEKAAGDWARELNEQIDILQEGFLAGEKDKNVLNKIISDLNKTVSRLKSEKEASDKKLDDFESLVTNLRQEIDTEKSKLIAAPDALTMEQIEARIANARDEAIKQANVEAQVKLDAMEVSKKEQVETTIKNLRMQINAQAQQHIKTRMDQWRLMDQSYREKIAALESKLSTAAKQIEWHGPRLATASGAVQHGHQRPTKHDQEILSQETFNPSKRRRLNSFGAAGITTPDFQHTRSASLISDTNVLSAGFAANTNGNTMMGGAHMQGQSQGTPNNIHRRQSSQNSNGSATLMTPTRSLSRQQNGELSPQQLLNMISPQQQQQQQQQQLFQQQIASNNASSQPPTSGSYGTYPTSESRIQPQIGSSQQTMIQPGNFRLFNESDSGTHPSQQMRQQLQSQAQAQALGVVQQPTQPKQSYGSAFEMPPPQPRAVQVSSKRSMSFDAQHPSVNQDVGRQYAPTLINSQAMTVIDGEIPFIGETYPVDNWFSTGGEPAGRSSTQRMYTPTLPSNASSQAQETYSQQPQQRGFQYHNVDPSLLQMGNPGDMPSNSNSTQNEFNTYTNNSRQPSVSRRASRASSHSTPAPTGRSRGRTPGPAGAANVSCVNCYRHWWEHECDGGEPCSNCVAEGVECVRQKCFNFAAGTCDKGDKCPNVHEGDGRYRNDSHLVDQAKAGKRPQRIGKKVDAAPAPTTRQQD